MQIFLLIWVIIYINYYELTRHYSLTRGCFGKRAIVTYFRSLRTLVFFFFFFFTKYVNQSARCIKVFFQTDIKFLQNATYKRFQSTEHVCGGVKRKTVRISG